MIELIYEWICNPGGEALMAALSISAVGAAVAVRIEERLKEERVDE